MRICIHCEDEIKPYEVIPDCKGKMHRECLLRSIIGSVAHQTQRCSCYGFSGEDDPKLTARENAKAAARYFLSVQDKAAKAKFN